MRKIIAFFPVFTKSPPIEHNSTIEFLVYSSISIIAIYIKTLYDKNKELARFGKVVLGVAKNIYSQKKWQYMSAFLNYLSHFIAFMPTSHVSIENSMVLQRVSLVIIDRVSLIYSSSCCTGLSYDTVFTFSHLSLFNTIY